MRKPGISKTRKHILQFIYRFVDERGYAPTVRDIVKGCSLSSTAVVQHHLNVLEKEGEIRRDREVFRSIQIIGRKSVSSVPLLGTIAAGEPIPVPSPDIWSSEAVETLDVTDDLTCDKQAYALRVKGMSMTDALIDDGDIVLIEPAVNVDDGDMVVAWLKNEQEVTLKRVYSQPEQIRLQPANRQMKPIYCNPENVEIQGRVVGVIRKM